MNTDKLEKDVIEKSFTEEGKKRLRCRDALEIAAGHQVAPHRIGGICNRKGIKIVACQLGCFK
ncbi:MAG: hypothetical protein R6U43_04830 [Candidatus Krumholzibacteriales bacterium]